MMSPSCFAVFALKFLQKSMMFTPCGPSAVPTGGAGVAFPAAISSFPLSCTFLAIVLNHDAREGHEEHEEENHTGFRDLRDLRGLRGSDLLHLQKVELHRRRSPEDRHHHLQRVLVEIHLVHHAVEAGERTL